MVWYICLTHSREQLPKRVKGAYNVILGRKGTLDNVVQKNADFYRGLVQIINISVGTKLNIKRE